MKLFRLRWSIETRFFSEWCQVPTWHKSCSSDRGVLWMMTKQDMSVLDFTLHRTSPYPTLGKKKTSTQECHQMGYVSSMEGTVITQYPCCDSWPKSCKATASISFLAATFYIATSLRRRSGAENGGFFGAWEFVWGICQWIYINFIQISNIPNLRSIILSFILSIFFVSVFF